MSSVGGAGAGAGAGSGARGPDAVGAYRALAPAKVNLGLFVGPRREADDRHELVSVMQSISLADELTLRAAPGAAQADELDCVGVGGAPEQNLAARALAAFRDATGWDAPPLRLSIVKRIPVAAGLGGGSADAAATLRLAAFASGLGDGALLGELAAALGADVPAQVSPGRWLATGAGEQLQALPDPDDPLGVLVLPLAAELSTAAVYAEADRLDLIRTGEQLAGLRDRLGAALGDGAALPEEQLLHNDLQQPAVALCAQISDELALARSAGAQRVLVSGSGPTVLALFAAADRDDDDRGSPAGAALLQRAAAALAGRDPAPILATSVGAGFGQVIELEAGNAAAGPGPARA